MRKANVLVVLLSVLILSGCASNQFGNFVMDDSIDQGMIANDAAEKVSDLYPPAKTKINLNVETPEKDLYGINLISSLRNKGYAVSEYNKDFTPNDGLSLTYIFDKFNGTDLYRSTIIIDGKKISRPYEFVSGKIQPAGFWVVGEN